MCLIQAISNRGLARASLLALVVLTWGRNRGHREIKRADSFVTWIQVHLALVRGSKSFNCWSLFFCHLLGERVGAQETFLGPCPGNTNREPGLTAVSSADYSQATGRNVVDPMADIFQAML